MLILHKIAEKYVRSVLLLLSFLFESLPKLFITAVGSVS